MYLYCVCVCVHVHICHSICLCGGQKTTLKSWFYLSTVDSGNQVSQACMLKFYFLSHLAEPYVCEFSLAIRSIIKAWYKWWSCSLVVEHLSCIHGILSSTLRFPMKPLAMERGRLLIGWECLAAQREPGERAISVTPVLGDRRIAHSALLPSQRRQKHWAPSRVSERPCLKGGCWNPNWGPLEKQKVP